jgi:folylpolyglutamate synthase/dihydropteroate synthase
LAPVVGSMLITRPGVRRAEEPEVVAELARRAGVGAVEVIREPASAFRELLDRTGDDAFVLVTGSLYLVGEILALVRHDGVPGPVSM